MLSVNIRNNVNNNNYSRTIHVIFEPLKSQKQAGNDTEKAGQSRLSTYNLRLL